MMNNKTFADKAIQIAKNYNTSYMLGAFGFKATNSNIRRLLNQCEENYSWLDKAENADWLFDCVNLIKGICWGWDGDTDHKYGGAVYCSNGMPDIDADSLHLQCTSVSNDFSKIEIGEILMTDGHCGIYVGNGCCVEATPSWNCSVQITAVGNIGSKSGLNTRHWKSHGKLKQIDYSVKSNTDITVSQPQINYKQAIPARYFSKGYAGQYRVQPSIGVNARTGPGTNYDIIKALSCGSTVQNYGYYSMDSQGRVWLYVVIPGGNVAYICKDYLV